MPSKENEILFPGECTCERPFRMDPIFGIENQYKFGSISWRVYNIIYQTSDKDVNLQWKNINLWPI